MDEGDPAIKPLSGAFFAGRLILLSLYIIFVLLIVFYFISDYKRNDALYMERVLNSLDSNFRGGLVSYEQSTELIFSDVVSKPEVLRLVEQALDIPARRDTCRDELYRLLLPYYEEQKKYGIWQVHFHLKDGTSFLRMHAPKKFGDNLFRRPGVYMVNTEKRPVAGYEVGYFADGFRYMYPLLYNGRHIGSIEFAITSSALISYMSRIAPGDYYFMIDRSVVSSMTYEDWLEMNFRNSELSEKFMVGIKSPESSVISSINRELKDRVNDRLSRMDRFMEKSTMNGDDYLIIFQPIKDLTGRPVAYFVQYINDLYSGNHLELAVLDIILFILLLSGIFYAIDNILTKRRTLEQQNIDLERTTNKLRQYRMLSQHARDIILFIEKDGRILEANEAAVKAYGYSVEELCLLNIKDLRAEETRPVVEKQMQDAYEHGIIFETRHRRKDGSTFPAEVSSIGMDISDRRILLSIIRDISERKEIQDAVAKSENLLRTIITNEPECVKLLAADGALLMMNPAGLRMIQADSFEQVRGQCVYPMVTPAYRDKFRDLTEDIFRGNSGKLEFEAVGLKGRHVWLDTHAVPLYDEKNEIFALLGITRDVTEGKLAEMALHESEETLRTIFTESPVGISLIDSDSGRFIKINRKYCDIVGYSMEEMLSMDFQSITHPDDLERDLGNMQKLRDEKTSSFIMEKRYVKKDRSIVWVELTVVPLARERSKLRTHIAIVEDITERKKVRDNLIKSEMRLKESQQVARIGSWSWDLIENTLEWSVETYRRFDKDPAIFTPTIEYFFDRIYPEDKAAIAKAIQDALENNAPYHIQSRIKNENGREWVLEGFGRVEKDHDGKSVRFAGTAQDITERVRREESLRESEERFRTMFEGAPDAIFLADPASGIIVDANPAASVLIKRPVSEIIGMHQADLHPSHLTSRSQEVFIEHITQSTGQTAVNPIEHIVQCADGTEIPVDIMARMITIHGKRLLQGIFRDISARKKAEKLIRESEKMYRMLFATVPLGWAYHRIIVDEQGHPCDYEFIEVNDAFEKLTGLKREEIIGKRVTHVLPGIEKDPAGWIRRFGAVAISGESTSFQNYSEALLSWYNVSVSSPEKYHFITVFEDITTQKRYEEQILRLNSELEAKNRDLEQLLYAASHDLKSPLVNIQGFSREIEYSLNDLSSRLETQSIDAKTSKAISNILGDDIPESMQFIRTSLFRMNNLLESLLKLSRVGRSETKKEPLNMNSVISSIYQSLKYQLQQKNVSLKCGNLPPCMGDETQITQVFSNLIGNALKYLSPERDGIITVTGRGDDGNVVYCVEDNGIGIAPEHQKKVFEIFYQLEPGTGEGIGLNIVQRILEKHGGKIRVESQPGKGSRFYVSLPV